MHHLELLLTRAAQACRAAFAPLADEVGEGVISTAIAVLVMSFVGAAMWLGFRALADSTCDSIAAQLRTAFSTGTDVNCGA